MFKLQFITPNGKLFDDQVSFISAPGVQGSFGVLTGHAPMVASLESGKVTIRVEQKETVFYITDGILEVLPNHDCLVLCSDAKAPVS